MKLIPRFSFLKIASVGVAAVLLSVVVQGALTWNTQRIELTTKPGDKEAIALFRFENRGQATVTITSVQPSCGCTTAELEKRSYAPGESGEIKAVFTLGGRVGEQEKTIYVSTDDPSARPVSLGMHVLIPELLTCSPRLLIWKVGGSLVEKNATIAAHTALKITAIELNRSSLPKELSARIELVESGTKYQLFVTPVSAAQFMNVVVSGTATFADGTILPFNIYALVR